MHTNKVGDINKARVWTVPNLQPNDVTFTKLAPLTYIGTPPLLETADGTIEDTEGSSKYRYLRSLAGRIAESAITLNVTSPGRYRGGRQVMVVSSMNRAGTIFTPKRHAKS